MAENEANEEGSDPLDALGGNRHDAAAEEIENRTNSDGTGDENESSPDPEPETEDESDEGNTSEDETGSADESDTDAEPEGADDTGAETDTGTSESESENESTSESGAESTSDKTADTDVGGVPDYNATSAYLADPELSKYRHTYFKRLELEFPELQGCQQRELQRALLSVAMNDEQREDVRDKAIQFRKRREAQE